MALDNNTFGDSPAAITLVKIINERNLRSDKVTNILVSFNSKIRDLNGVNVTTVTYIMSLIYQDHVKKCDSLPKPLNTYTKNVLSTIYKNWQVRKNVRQPRKKRK